MVTVDSGLKTYAVGAYSENGPGFGCAPINARRIRLVARWLKGLDAPHPNRTQKTTDRTGVHRGIVGWPSVDERRQGEDRGRQMVPNAFEITALDSSNHPGPPSHQLKTTNAHRRASLSHGGHS